MKTGTPPSDHITTAEGPTPDAVNREAFDDLPAQPRAVSLLVHLHPAERGRRAKLRRWSDALDLPAVDGPQRLPTKHGLYLVHPEALVAHFERMISKIVPVAGDQVEGWAVCDPDDEEVYGLDTTGDWAAAIRRANRTWAHSQLAMAYDAEHYWYLAGDAIATMLEEAARVVISRFPVCGHVESMVRKESGRFSLPTGDGLSVLNRYWCEPEKDAEHLHCTAPECGVTFWTGFGSGCFVCGSRLGKAPAPVVHAAVARIQAGALVALLPLDAVRRKVDAVTEADLDADKSSVGSRMHETVTRARACFASLAGVL